MAHRDVRTHDPRPGDEIEVEEERFEVVERCPCGSEAHHIRWFLQGGTADGPAPMAEEAVLSKEWDEGGEQWWWFGRRIAVSDLRTGRERLTQRLRRAATEPPKRLFYEGRLYRLALVNEPPKEPGRQTIPLGVWEYVDADNIESVLVERSPEGDTIAYHGAYYDPEDIKTA